MSTINLDNKTILVTGAAGFIGSNLVKRIYQEAPSATVVGIDNMNDYYDVALKEFRLKELAKYPTFTFVKGNIADKELITELLEKYKPSVVVNLAAQAGVRYSITNPDAYVESNLVGFFNILEACRHCESLEHLSKIAVCLGHVTTHGVQNGIVLLFRRNRNMLQSANILSRNICLDDFINSTKSSGPQLFTDRIP